MENDFLCGLENFESVWRRVRGEAPPTAPYPGKTEDTQVQRLSGLLDEIYVQSSLLCDLAQCCPAAQSALFQIASGEKKHFRSLQLEHFLLTGKCRKPSGKRVRFSGAMEGLRLAWLREQRMTEQMKDAAKACSGTLHELLLCIAGEEEKHAQGIRGILRRLYFA